MTDSKLGLIRNDFHIRFIIICGTFIAGFTVQAKKQKRVNKESFYHLPHLSTSVTSNEIEL